MKKEKKSLFAMEVENNANAHELTVALNMVGLSIDIQTTDLILNTLEKLSSMKGSFDIATAVTLQFENNEKFTKIRNAFENQ